MSRSPRVYIIYPTSIREDGTGPDYIQLAKFGTLTHVIDNGDYPVYYSASIAKKIEERMTEFNPEMDYLAWAGGDPLAAVMVGAYLGTYGYCSIKWLRLDREKNIVDGRRFQWKGRYVPIILTICQDDEENVYATTNTTD